MRVALGIEYDGSGYAGWQRQPLTTNLLTVQTVLELAASTIANHPVSIVCSGRTDAGVHAVQQVVHFDTYTSRSEYNWVHGLNALLPNTVSVRWACFVDENFHARHSALERRYTYALYNHPVRPTLLHHQVGWVYKPLSLILMQEAGKLLIGQHDFSTFRASQCQAHTPIRTVTDLQIEQQGQFFLLHIQANAFLHHMIRNVVGSLVYVGTGRWTINQFKGSFLARDRRQGAPTFSPDGLYFCGAIYTEHFNIPKPAKFQCLMV